MDSNTVFRLAAAGLSGLVLFAAALALSEPDVPEPIRVFPAVVPADPLAAELTRCRKLGLEAAGNQACEEAWAENRARFFSPPNVCQGALMMGGSGVIDQFLNVFTTYIDSGFGLLGGDVRFLSQTLIALDITLAGLFWALAGEADIIARLIKKTLYIGFFAFLIGNFNKLAKIIFDSFSGLGLKAAGSGLSADRFSASGPHRAGGSRRRHADPHGRRPADGLCLLLREFHSDHHPHDRLGDRGHFLLHPCRSALHHVDRVQADDARRLHPRSLRPFQQNLFLGRKSPRQCRRLGRKNPRPRRHHWHRHEFFSQFTQGFGGNQPTIEDALSLVLASLSLLGLGIFGPGIATGLVSGAPQLGAGAAIGTGLAAAGLGAAGVIGARAGAGALVGATSFAAHGGAAMAGGAATAYGLAAASSGESGLRRVGAGVTGVAKAGIGAAAQSFRKGASDGPPGWAQRMRRDQAMSHGISTAAHAVRSGEHGGGSSSVSLHQDDQS